MVICIQLFYIQDDEDGNTTHYKVQKENEWDHKYKLGDTLESKGSI